MDKVKLLIAVPVGRPYVDIKFVASLISSIDFAKDYYDLDYTLMFAEGARIADNRNRVWKAFSESTYTHLLFVDDDMIIPRNAIAKMLCDDKQIVSALCVGRKEPHDVCVYKKWVANNEVEVMTAEEVLNEPILFKICACGMALVLFKHEVAEIIDCDRPFDEFANMGEDLSFCSRVMCGKYGILAYCDKLVKAGHIGQEVYYFNNPAAEEIKPTYKKPLFSVIIPCHNAEDRITNLAYDVLTQTFKDCEIIFVCDSCTDDTKELLESLAESHKDRKIYIVECKHSNPGMARNEGLECASGDYILFFDDDDRLVNALQFEALAKKIKDNPNVDIFAMSFLWNSEDYTRPLDNDGHYFPNVWSKCYKRSFIGDTRFENVFAIDDLRFNEALDEKMANVYCWDFLWYDYNYMRPGSITEQVQKGQTE